MKLLRLFALRATARALAVVALGTVAVAAPAVAKEGPKIPDTPAVDENEVLGEARIEMKIQFVKFVFDDKKEWDNHEYVDGAKTLIIKGIERNTDHTVVLTPRESGYEPVTLTLKASDFKRTVIRTKGRTQTLTFRATYRPDFKKVEAPKQDSKP
jgi:hypothetical protein